MEILQSFKRNGYFTAEIYHLLATKKLLEKSMEIIPSTYEKEMQMTTTERLQTLNSIEIDNMISSGDIKSTNVLSFTPRIIVFQNFKPNEKIIAKFSVKNISQAPAFLNMVFKESSYFFIKPCGAQLLSRLAPGISVTFAVTFTPVQYDDYIHRVTFFTDKHQYVLPLIAMGPRPIFDFPDEVIIPKVPLKVENYYSMVIHNRGYKAAGFTLNTKTPFSVYPKSAYLNPDEKIEIKVIFKTMHIGIIHGTLYAILETGENFRIKLRGTTHTVCIELEKEVVRFPETYNTMVRQQIFKITNRSDHLLTYMCMKNDCIYYDFEDKVKLATIFYDLKGSESAKYRKLVQYDVLSSDEHERVYTRIFFDEIQALVADETLFFQNTHFAISPIKGQLWPNKTTEITVTFAPKEVGEFSAIAHFDIDGIMDRVPLKMVGLSMPPSIHLNVETIDMDLVYINKTYHYEIVAMNKGHINGVIVYKEVPTLFGSTISCTPEMHCLRPGDKEVFIISFCNSNQGPYFEELNFIIRDTKVVLKLYLKGTVVYPSLTFSVPCLDFGFISVGVPKTLEFDVINESVVNVKGSLKISSDGPEVSSITLDDCAVAENPKLDFPQWPREFKIEPSIVEIEPESRVPLKVTLIANLTRANRTALELELDKSDSPPIVLPVMFDARVPELIPAPDIKLRVCFLDYPYQQDINIISNDFYGYFTIEEPDVESTLKVDVGIKRGFIEPNSTLTLPITIMTSVLGMQEYVIRMFLFGVTKPVEICHITVHGVRPIVTITPVALHWGQVKLLTKSQKIITLCNDSPVTVYYKAFLLNRDNKWQIYPSEGFIDPEGEVDLLFTLYLLDSGSYINKAIIQLEKVKDILVPLSATGVGTSIVVGPLRDTIILGRHFTKILMHCKVTIENYGTRLHVLEWNEFFKPPKTKVIPPPFFAMDPKSYKLGPGEKIELTVTAVAHKAGTVKETWYLIGSVEGVNKKELLMECPVSAEFVDPKIEVSSNFMEFRYDHSPYSVFYKLTDILTIKNVSKLPLDIDINIKQPFAIIHKQGTYKVPSQEENMCCCITYNESDLNVPRIKSEVGYQRSQIYIDCLTDKPIEPLKRGPLHFFENIHRIKMAFNLTNEIQERLEDKEVMKIQILFDTTKHMNLKSKVYCDLMRIRFVGHKNKDAIKIIGNINFPNIQILSPKVDFKCVQNGTLASKTIKVQNVTPLLVCYKFQWKKFNAITRPDVPIPNFLSKKVSEVKVETEDTESKLSEVNDVMANESGPLVSEANTMDNEYLLKEIVSHIQNIDLELLREDSSHLLKIRFMQKIAPMINMATEDELTWTSKLGRLVRYNKIHINELFQLTPHRGLLKPNDVQLIHVIFRPNHNVSVKAVLECEVLGGPPEYVTLYGHSSDLLYSLNTKKLNFKIRSFHIDASEKLILTNAAGLPFEYKTYMNEPTTENELEAVIREINLSEKLMEAEETAEIEIIVKPGILGYFNRVFILEIGHYPHIPIEVFGWGVIPQVYLSLPRPDIAKLPRKLGYKAIATLTLEYLEAINELFSTKSSEHLNTPQEEKCFADPNFQNDWHICSSWDGCPSNIDIELAIERLLLIQHVAHRPDMLTPFTTGVKTGPIPNFITIPYVIDYGVVITGSTVQCTVEIINYGPLTTKLHFSRLVRAPHWLSLKLCGKLNPGETGTLDVVFAPIADDFPELEQAVETVFNIEVPYGVSIPIKVKALCAVPYLATNITSLKFGTVRCGDKIVSKIPLKNVGQPTCIWYVTLRLKGHGPNPMTIQDSSGKYEPGEEGWLSVSFKPTMEMMYEGLLVFRFHMNPNKLIIPVKGQGILPHVHVIGPNLNFPPTLPWAETTDLYFGLTNTCPFPIELIIVHSDEKWKEEEEILQLLYKYYNKPKELLIKAIEPGAGMPLSVVNFSKTYKENVRRAIEEETKEAAKVVSARPSAHVKKKSPKNAPKNAPPTKDAIKEPPPVRKFRTEAEIRADEMQALRDDGVDPLSDYDSVRHASESSVKKHSKGFIIFVYGSPVEEMECQEMAYTLSKSLGLPIVNMDLCIVEALCICDNPAKDAILSAITESYEMLQRLLMKGSDDVDEDFEEVADESEDEYDVILRKLNFIATSKSLGTPRSKTSEKRKSTTAPTSHIGITMTTGAVTMFQMELIQELLTEYFSLPKFQRGFIVDTLNSVVIKSPPLLLTTVLKSKSTIWNIHLILCQSDFSKWAQAYEEKLQHENELNEESAPKVYDDQEILDIVESFEDMDDTEFDNAPEELKALYITYGLESRRQKYYEKLGVTAEIVAAKKEKLKGFTENKSTVQVLASESRKKIKKDDSKGKPTPEYLAMFNRYNEYTKTSYENLVQIATNWIIEEGELGFPLYALNGQLVGAAQKKSKKKSEVHLLEPDIQVEDRGFPLTIITCPCLDYKKAVVNMFTRSSRVREALTDEPKIDILKCPINKKHYTVLLQRTMPTINHEESLQWLYLDESPIKKCECNQITDIHLLDDTTQDNVINILSKWHCTCGKKLASSQTSTTDIPSVSAGKYNVEEHGAEESHDTLPLRCVKTMPVHGGRLVLQPGDLIRCKYTFNPQVEGNFSVKRFVDVSGWPDSRAVISVNGICDLPRLDNRPKKMFANFVRRTIENKVYKHTYLDNLKLFEFGPIFIGSHRVYEEEYTIDLKNSSLMTANVDIEFQDDTNVFQIDKNFISLESGCRGKLTITAAPTEVGVHTCTLIFCVKDNPEVIMVNIACSGVMPVVQILPQSKIIDYGKLLLYRREDDRFIIKNDSILPIMWKIRDPEAFLENFIIAHTSGIIPQNDNQVIPVTYIACNVGVIANQILIIDIYDEQGRGDPMLVDQLMLYAECYDVMVECAHENPSENFLNFGNVKVNSTEYRQMYLINRGKYNIFYKLKKVKNFPEPQLLKSFEASDEVGMIPPPPRVVCIEFECTPVTSMNLVNVPAYTCSLLDGSREQVVVAKFPVCITIASFYNTFTLFPLGELNFNIIAIGTGIIREVILNNTSKCPFTYEIILPPNYANEGPEEHHLPPSKGKDTKIKNPPLKCGNFLIINEDNLLPPGTSRTIPIQFIATAARLFEETIHFVISDTCPAEASGVPLKLIGTGAKPRLAFWNTEITFREHLIVKTLSDDHVPEPSPHCVFAEDTVTLHFFGVIVNTSFTAVIDLYNDGLVPCILTMKLHYQSNTNQDIFCLDKYDTHIEALQHKNLGIIFTPKVLEEYRAVLEIKLKALENQEVSFKLCLIGEGVIPRIRLISPPLRQHKLALLKFPVTCLGSVTTQSIRFKNVSSVKATVNINVLQPPYEQRPVFWLNTVGKSDDTDINDNLFRNLKIIMRPGEVNKIYVYYNPIKKGRTNCDVNITILNNPYEFFTVLCEAEAFMEDVILVGLEMLSMEADLDAYRSSGNGTQDASVATTDSRKKTKSAPVDKKKPKDVSKRSKKDSQASIKPSDTVSAEPSNLMYILDFGGCELNSMQRRTVVMVNNSEKVYKFNWIMADTIMIKPSMGYISPGEEKDLEIIFFSAQPVCIRRETMCCSLIAISDDTLTMDMKGATWDNRQTLTLFDQNRENSTNERQQTVLDEQHIMPAEDLLRIINMFIVYSVKTAYTKYSSTLKDEITLLDTYIYQKRTFDFKVENVGKVPMKIAWSFYLDDEYPVRLDKRHRKKSTPGEPSSEVQQIYNDNDANPPDNKEGSSRVTLFSGSEGRESVDTWFEVDLPFTIKPAKECLKPQQSRIFTVTFAPLEAFDFKVHLKSSIDNLDPYDQNICCKINAKSLIPYVHLNIEESDYLTANRRKATGVVLPEFTTVLEFNVLGPGCYRKEFQVINPTGEGYEFVFNPVDPDKEQELVPVHCNTLKGFVEGGTSAEVAFTFSPAFPGIYESPWTFVVNAYHLVMPILVVGIVKEPQVAFVPTILIIKDSLVGFTTTCDLILQNNEHESLNFEFMGNSLGNESGKSPVIMQPEKGVMKPNSATPIRLIFTPIQDGPVSFKIFCKVQYLANFLTLCVNALSHSINPIVSYYLIGNSHILNKNNITNIYLDQTASTYERTLTFTIKNQGSATFFYDWHYTSTPVKKYLQVYVEPKSGHIAPADEAECILHFTLKQVPVQAYPLTLSVSDGPEYEIYLHAEIEKPLYHFSSKEIDFGKCIVNAPDTTYKKNLAVTNDDENDIILDLNFVNLPELYVDFKEDTEKRIKPNHRIKLPLFFRPKEVKEYEIKLHFWVNSLCEEIVTIKGEGVPLLVDVYEGCQKSFYLGPVKVGTKVIRQIEVMNHSKVPIDASFIFKDLYNLGSKEDDMVSEATTICLDPSTPGIIPSTDAGPSRVKSIKNYTDSKTAKLVEEDIKNALSSLKVLPTKCKIKPYQKVPVKIHFKPVSMINDLSVQLNVHVLNHVRPLVSFHGCATGMNLHLSQNSIQFGRVRKHGCRVIKVMLENDGDFNTRFCWQPLKSDEFTISPMKGDIAARTKVTFTITFRPINDNPFVKVWASCNIENYKVQELAMYATCMDAGQLQMKTVYFECPVRDVKTEYIAVENPTDDTWLIVSELSGGPFETPREFNIDNNSSYDIPIHFKPKTMGQFESQVLYSPFGENALIVTLIAIATYPNPNDTLSITVKAKTLHTQILPVLHITEEPESYVVSTEVEKIVPDKFEGYYEVKHQDTIKVWGETKASCRWSYICFEPCEMEIKVMFINEKTREFQFYAITATVTESEIVDTLTFTSRARESVQKEISIRNPLGQEATFNISCLKLSCPDKLKISRNSQTQLVLTYSPLVVEETEDTLQVTNELIGTYLYKVLLKCLPAKKKDVELSTPLGNCIPARLRVYNKTDDKATFVTSVTHSSILAEREYMLGPQEKGKFLIWFEPTEHGVQNSVVTFDSPTAGEFVFNIRGIGADPKPQGPLEIKAGGSTMIKFKNVFDDTRMFKIYVDREEFYVKSLNEPIKSKRDMKVVVYLSEMPPAGWKPGEIPTGCLTIECAEPSEPRVQWTYFLQGI